MTEFDNCLQSLLSLKPPGISTSKVKELTALCSQNVQVTSALETLSLTPSGIIGIIHDQNIFKLDHR